jgi:hypothetical protein
LLSLFYAILTLSLHFCCAKQTDAEKAKAKAKTKTLCCAKQTATQTTSGKKNAEVELGASGEGEFAPVGAGHVSSEKLNPGCALHGPPKNLLAC